MKKTSNKKIKILFVHANNEDVGGADFCLYKIVSSLDKNEYDSLVILRKNTSIVNLYEKAGLKVKLLPIVRLQKTKNIFKLILTVVQFPLSVGILMFQIINNKVDIVHSNDLLDLSGSIAAKITHTYSVQHVRMILTQNDIINYIISKIILICNNKIICISNATKNALSINSLKISVIYDPIDLDIFQTKKNSSIKKTLSLNSKTKLIAVIGRLEWWKGQEIFIKASKIIQGKYHNVVFLVIGGKVHKKESYADYLQNLRQESGLSNKLHFLGHIDNMKDVYREIDILVHTSILPEPLGNIIAEGMFMEKAIVASRLGGVLEQIDDKVTGLLYAPGNPIDLAKKIILLLENEEYAKKMGLEARKFIVNKFNKSKILKQLDGIYKAAVN